MNDFVRQTPNKADINPAQAKTPKTKANSSRKNQQDDPPLLTPPKIREATAAQKASSERLHKEKNKGKQPQTETPLTPQRNQPSQPSGYKITPVK